MSLRTLSEAVILQSAEDLLSASHRREGLEFFSGEGFRLCAEMAGMTFDEKIRFLHMLMGYAASGKEPGECSDETVAGCRVKSGELTHSYGGRRSARLSAM